jgi:hypothetical protein
MVVFSPSIILLKEQTINSLDLIMQKEKKKLDGSDLMSSVG